MTIRKIAEGLSHFTIEQWERIAKLVGIQADLDEQLSQADAERIVNAGREIWNKVQLMEQKTPEVAPVPAPAPAPAPVPVAADAGDDPDSEPEEFLGYSVSTVDTDEQPPSTKEARAIENMSSLIRDYKTFIDLSSLLAPQSLKAMPHLIEMLDQNKRKLFLPKSASDALNHTAKEGDDETRNIAQNSIKHLKMLQSKGLLDIRGGVTENSTSAQDIYQSCAHFRMQHPLLVITQDKDLTTDLIALNRQESARGYVVRAKKFNKYGYLSNVKDPPPVVNSSPKNNKPPKPAKHQGESGRFLLASQPRREPDKLIPVTMVPAEGDEVYTAPGCSGVIRLTKKLAEGGEGLIYETNAAGMVAKIYKQTHITEYRREKVTKMVQAQLKFPGICFPEDVLYNNNGEFVGYLMQTARGVTLDNCMRKRKIGKYFPDWNRKDLAQLALTILDKIDYIHTAGLLIGDINEKNIMVVSPTEVFLVDTDSYQVNDLPCQVATPPFWAPELLDRQARGEFHAFSEILRTPQNEYFAVATLLFMIMMQGKPPYSHTDGGNMVDNIKEMHFPYADGQRGSDGVPEGAWRFMWSHLGYNIKQAFQKCFNKNFNKDKGYVNSAFNMKERLNIVAWLREMDRYHQYLCKVEENLREYNQKIEAGIIDGNIVPPPEDEQDLWLYPTRLKWARSKEGVYTLKHCKRCGKWTCHKQLSEEEKWCYECREKGEETKCAECGKDFIYTDYDKMRNAQRGVRHDTLLCRKCRKLKSERTDKEKREKREEWAKRSAVVYEGECQRPGCVKTAKILAWMAEEDKARYGEVRCWCNRHREIFADRGRIYNRGKGQNETKPAAPAHRPATSAAQPAAQRTAGATQTASAQRPTPTQRPAAAPAQRTTIQQRPAAAPVQRTTTTTQTVPAQRTTTQQRPAAAPIQRPAATPKNPVPPQTKKSSGSSGCFITTAACDYYGKPDDCRELTDFRSFRDNWLRHQPGGEELVREYYTIAPELVRRMRASADFPAICTEIWEDYLLPCQRMIHENRLEDCRDHYIAMVRHLQTRVGAV